MPGCFKGHSLGLQVMRIKSVFVGLGIGLFLSACQSAHQQKPAHVAQQSDAATESEPDTPQTEPFFQSYGEASNDAERLGLSDTPSPAQSEATYAAVEYDIPIVMNERVEFWLNYFQTRGRKYFAAWMSRSGKYIPMMKEILIENGLPQDLVYLSMIESGFKPYAYSHAHASGLWQFIRRTGQHYGLNANWWYDERRDPEKSTLAAAAHLKDLYDYFNNWYLAAAGYNAGQYKIIRAIKRYNTEDFWEMSRFSYLKPETKNYVPKIIAAAMVAKNPEKYGFTDIAYEEPLIYDKVIIEKPTELAVVAKYIGTSKKDLENLNPELLRGVTPPNYPNYELKIPHGKKERFVAAYDDIKKYDVVLHSQHQVRSGENLSTIGKRYGLSYQKIMAANNMRSTRIRAGQKLVIPSKSGYSSSAAARNPAPAVNKNASHYTMRRGDTLWSVSRRFGVSISQLRSWNNIENASAVRAGTRLNLKAQATTVAKPAAQVAQQQEGNQNWIYHTVKKGESLWSIANRFGVPIQDIMEWNDLNPEGLVLYPGNALRIKALNL